jgi:hypothetical protein
MSKSYVWFICPSCRSRLAVDRDHTDEVRCRNCSTLIRAAKATVSADAKHGQAAQTTDHDDEYRVAPLDDERRFKAPPKLPGREPPINKSDSVLAPAPRERAGRSTGGRSHKELPGASAHPPIDGVEIRNDERYAPAPPPRWTFFSGVWTYPWRPQSLLPWTVLTLGFAICGFLAQLVVGGLQSFSQAGALTAGGFGIACLLLSMLTGSYAAACLFAITETTAYNYDDPYDWPDPDWRERLMHLLWLGWCMLLAAALLVGPAMLVTDSPYQRFLITAIGAAILFPIFVLSTLETNSLVPVSGPIWRSIATDAAAWITFYVLTGAVVALGGWVTTFLLSRMGMLAVLVLGLLWATCVLIYARLLGRLAWRIMRPSELQLQKWRRSLSSTLAADSRRTKQTWEVDEPADDE